MNQQCENCKWWSADGLNYGSGICGHNDTPDSVVMHCHDGDDCEVYEERKE